ncbi:SRPBCC domain-containing protein [Kribbella albertanoniae]|uniref:SRPBCC domain-containing protein n=1 Tax=Kribbella albertanoniae TaxID=1266829 RepID=A0A4R4Q8R1_9ACTN|nr:SRPBCC domain-containing protein [Kribbella albertanoniae]TDC31627.1 SRPBCC domain-containing protein [Kribbella albertanoniae]
MMRRLLVGLGVFVLLLIGYTTYTIVRPTVLRTEVEIDASPDQVWTVLADREHYPAWNPFIVASTGDLIVGATITNVLRDTKGAETTFTPKLLAVQPGRELRWIGRIGFGGVFDGEHAFRIEALPNGRSKLIQEEIFRGAAVPFTAGMLRDTIEPQFHAMNQAIATRAVQGR